MFIQDSVTITQLKDTEELARMIDKLELPDQMAAVLNNRLLQHVLICCGDGKWCHWVMLKMNI